MLPQIKIQELKRLGYFPPIGTHFGEKYWRFCGERLRIAIATMDLNDSDPHLRLWHTTINEDGSENKTHDYRFPLVKRRCHFGGFRWFFRCPWCANLARVLYLHPDAREFECRQCCDLTYRSCNESHKRGYFKLLDLIDKYDNYDQQIKRYQYRGIPTKKYKKVVWLSKKLGELMKDEILINLAKKL